MLLNIRSIGYYFVYFRFCRDSFVMNVLSERFVMELFVALFVTVVV